MKDDLTAIPGQKTQQGRAKSFKRALDANIDGIPNSPGMRKAIASKAKTTQTKSTTSIEGEVVRVGRPSSYTEETAHQICEYIADGETLISIGAMDDMPSRETIRQWLRNHDQFLADYTRAREEQADAFADDITKTAMDAAKGSIDPLGARVKIDALKWIAGKRKPKVYGDKVDLTSDGKALPQPLFGGVSITTDVKQLKADT